MINLIHSRLHRPEQGWDPITPEYAAGYSTHAEAVLEIGVIDQIESQIGPLAGRRVLDLGGGRGQYTVALAQRGGRVVWHDGSHTYRGITEQRAGRVSCRR